VPETVDIRNKNAHILDEGLKELAEYISVPPRPVGCKETFSLYMVRFEKRDALLKYLIDREIEAKIHYPIPLHLQKAAEYLNYKPGDFPVAETYSKEIMTLPVHQYITKDQIDYTLRMIKAFYKHA
jgi:aminotransferase EvaB